MDLPCTLADLIAAHPGDRVALAAPGCASLTFGVLGKLADETVSSLNAFGIGRNDRVAVVLPNGPEMAAAFLAVGAGATVAPLNPAYREDEFHFYLKDLSAKALIVSETENGPAVGAAARLDIPVLRLVGDAERPAGSFSLLAEGTGGEGTPVKGYAGAADTALVLHTSGTTSRPKIVPLSQANICASAEHIVRTLHLEPADRGMNIMPLFHIHGLIANVLAPMRAGTSIYCTPGFDAFRVFEWFADARPTWYSAVPTMHQAILARARRNAEITDAMQLRFVRSSSSSLPPQVMRELETLFRCPVIESYGMTEAAHQMASNPLPPAERRAGSVGVAAGPDIAVMDEAGSLLVPGKTGEVVIRGPNVMAAYENNPEANESAFAKGWFRTGDQGVLDGAGYLTITGRLKEIINRGGEKISPREVDEALMDHAAVQQVVTFALPHRTLGEEVAAAVVLAEGAEASDRDLKDFAGARLADFKVPRRIVFVDEIPKGATGKLQRIGLAEKLGLAP